MVFVEERIDTINDGTFSMQRDFDESHSEQWILRDKPGSVHKRGCNLAYADGHAQLHRWQDARTVSASRDDALMPANADMQWLESHGTWRK